MRILKFGGTSVGDAASIRTVAQIVGREAPHRPLVVLSATGDSTDRLAEIGRLAAKGRLFESLSVVEALESAHRRLCGALLDGSPHRVPVEAFFDEAFFSLRAVARGLDAVRDFSPAVQDRLLSLGELLSTRLIAEVLAGAGLPVEWVDIREVVVTDEAHTCAEPLAEETARRCGEILRPLVESGRIPVTQGFIARSVSGAPTTLGRGGSDYTASLLGAALGAEEVQIWTDVDGVMTADPSLVPGARSIPVMGFEEAAELAFFGARVLHPRSLQPAVERGIPVRVLNTRNPEGTGTLVLAEAPANGAPVKSVAYKEGMTLVTLVSARMFHSQGFLARLFAALERAGAAPDLVATSEVSVAFALWEPARFEALATELRGFGRVEVREGQALVCVVGERLKSTPGIAAQVFEDLRDVRTSLISLGGSEINLSFVVDEQQLPVVVRRLHRRFFEAPEGQEVAG